MARQVHNRDIAPVLAAAAQWINICLIEDRAVFSPKALWTNSLVSEVYQAFVEHPDYGIDDFMTKLKGQMAPASASAQQLMAEMLWALLLFPSNMKARTKAQQVRTLWAMSGESLPDHLPLLEDEVLAGIGSGGPGFNNYRPDEMTFLIELTCNLKAKAVPERRHILTDYDTFVGWIDTVHREAVGNSATCCGFSRFLIALKESRRITTVERFSPPSVSRRGRNSGTGATGNSMTRFSRCAPSLKKATKEAH
jgi:5-methylcytosine-specific restriction protein B